MRKAHPIKPHRINLTTDKGTSSHATELAGQFGIDEFISTLPNNHVMAAIAEKSARKWDLVNLAGYITLIKQQQPRPQA